MPFHARFYNMHDNSILQRIESYCEHKVQQWNSEAEREKEKMNIQCQMWENQSDSVVGFSVELN